MTSMSVLWLNSQKRDSAGGLHVTSVIHAGSTSQVYILLSLISVHELPEDHWTTHVNKPNEQYHEIAI